MPVATSGRERQLGDLLIEQGVITPLELDEALQRQRLTGDLLGRVIVAMGLCEEQAIVDALANQSGMERVDLARLKVSDDVLRSIPVDVAKFYSVAPVRITDGVVLVAMADPQKLETLDDLRRITGHEVKGAISNPHDVAEFLKKNYSYEGESIHSTLEEIVKLVGDKELSMDELGVQQIVGDTDNLVMLAQEPQVIQMVNLIFLESVQKRASDIHFEIYEDSFRVRIRIDGLLTPIVEPPKHMALALVSRVKVMCNMDIGERRLPQDARIEVKVGDAEIDIRVATLPTLYGECLVMRILDRTAVKVDIHKLGFAPEVLKSMVNVINKPNGIFLVTGPTGSGKTTTLYACVNELNAPDVKIITTEDPVELQLDRVVQCQVKEDIGLTFAACLRSILRQDPDIVMVGEIRDLETAQIAIEASLTGHLVLSTLHTNSAPETITRLLDMDVEPFLITASLEAVLAQRLIRVLCRYCREKYSPPEEEREALGLPESWNTPDLAFYRPVGCPACDHRGYMGRTGLFELLLVDENISEMILNRAMAFELRRYARKNQGMRTLREEGIIKCYQGITSVLEVLENSDKFDD